MDNPYCWQISVSSTRKKGESHLVVTVRLIDPALGLDPFVNIPIGRERSLVPKDTALTVKRLRESLASCDAEGISHHIPDFLVSPYYNVVGASLRVKLLPRYAKRLERNLRESLRFICEQSSTPLTECPAS